MAVSSATNPMDGAFTLVVEAATTVALDITLFVMRDAAGTPLPSFTPGAHVAVQAGQGVVRKYSLCNDPQDRDRYEIAVKRESTGRGGSGEIIDRMTVGSRVRCTPPKNDFPLVPRATSHLFIAGGIGITPILSMVRHLTSTGAGRFKLYYCTRSPDATAFLAELSAPAHRGRVTIHHDNGDSKRAFDLWPVLERPAGQHVYCCGPRSLMESVRDMTGHWPSTSVHFESFVDAAAMHSGVDRPFRVRLARSGDVIEVAADQSILEALRAAGHTAPSSCESGTCGTCRTGLLAGEALHRDLVLADSERADNIMICVSRARSAEIVIDR